MRFRLLSDYDSFADGFAELRQKTAALATMPAFVPATGQQAFHAKLAEFEQLLGQKEQLLESFKSDNAVLNNSLRYLPVASSELRVRLANDAENRGLEAQVNGLMQAVLVYCLNPGEEQVSAIDQSLAKLAEWRQENPAHSYAAPIGGVAAHVASVVGRKPKIEALTQQIVAIPTGRCIDELQNIYDAQIAAALRQADSSRSGLDWEAFGGRIAAFDDVQPQTTTPRMSPRVSTTQCRFLPPISLPASSPRTPAQMVIDFLPEPTLAPLGKVVVAQPPRR